MNKFKFIFLLLLFISCSKENNQNETPNYKILDLLISSFDGSSILTKGNEIVSVGRQRIGSDFRMMLYKTNLRGEIMDTTSFYSRMGKALSVYEDKNNDFYITGYLNDEVTEGKRRLAIAKMKNDGVIAWEKIYHEDENILGYQIAGLNQNEIIISGETDSGIFILKIDSLGQEQSFKILENSEFSTTQSLIKLHNGNFLITGSDQETNLSLASYDSQLNPLWKKSFGPRVRYGNSTIQLEDGSLITIGSYSHLEQGTNRIIYEKVLILKTDSIGDFIWEREIGNSDLLSVGTSIAQNDDGTFVITGYNFDVESFDLTNHMLILIDSEGNEINSKYYTDIKTFRGYKIIKILNDRNVILGNGVDGSFFLNVDNFGIE